MFTLLETTLNIKRQRAMTLMSAIYGLLKHNCNIDDTFCFTTGSYSPTPGIFL